MTKESSRLGLILPFHDRKPGDGSHRPRYVQIREELIERLAQGEWRAGDLLPGESRLAAAYNVAQGTMRKAIDHLVQQNLLVRRQGKGTYVGTHDRHQAVFHFNRLVGRMTESRDPCRPPSCCLAAKERPIARRRGD